MGVITNPGKHRLIIHSLYDTDIACGCDRWSLTGTGRTTTERATEEWQRHLLNAMTRGEAIRLGLIQPTTVYVVRVDIPVLAADEEHAQEIVVAHAERCPYLQGEVLEVQTVEAEE